jgi:hypothetical protein
MKRRNVLLALLVVLVAAVLLLRRTREHACPLAQASAENQEALLAKCTSLGGVIKDGKCVCPDGSDAA